MILVVDFGGQYKELIARRVRELNIYCEVISYKNALEKAKDEKVKGIIFTGGPSSVYEENSPQIEKEIFELNKPILGLCYGMQLMAHTLGGKVIGTSQREFGKTKIITKESVIFENLNEEESVWMSHNDRVEKLPEGFEIIAESKTKLDYEKLCQNSNRRHKKKSRKRKSPPSSIRRSRLISNSSFSIKSNRRKSDMHICRPWTYEKK